MLPLAAALLLSPPALADDVTPSPLSETTRLTAEQSQDLNLMLGIIRDTDLQLPRRRDAATSLLLRGWPAAVDALVVEFLQTDDPVTRRAIAAAAAATPAPPPGLIQPMLDTLADADPALRTDLAEALGRYENHGVTEKLITLATNPNATLPERIGATQALAEHRTHDSVDTLLLLTDPAQPPSLRVAAFASLQQLTGIESFGSNRRNWQDWWENLRDLPRDRWLAKLIQSLSEKNKQLATAQTELESRLTDTLNQLYVAQDEQQRSQMISHMLDDTMPAVRLLSLRLIERKILNAQPISENTRRALRRHLIDPAPAVRATCALRLRDLDDQPAAQIVLQRLLTEEDPAVQNAYLSLLTRQPSANAVDPALVLLARDTNLAAACDLLIAAHNAQPLTPQQQDRARQSIRAHLASSAPPVPAAVRLLSLLAQPADHATLANLLDHENTTVSIAAAESFTHTTLPIKPLTDRLSNPLLTDTIIQALGKRADDLPTALSLTRHNPTSDTQTQNLRTALLAIANRLSPSDLVQLDNALIDSPSLRSLRADTLRRATEIDTSEPTHPELLLRLARLKLDAGQTNTALALYNQLPPTSLSPPQQHRAALGRIQIDLQTDQHARAIESAEQLDADAPDLAPRIAALMLDAAQRALDAQQTKQAAAIIGHTQRILGSRLPAAAAKRIDQIKEKLPTPQAVVEQPDQPLP